MLAWRNEGAAARAACRGLSQRERRCRGWADRIACWGNASEEASGRASTRPDTASGIVETGRKLRASPQDCRRPKAPGPYYHNVDTLPVRCGQTYRSAQHNWIPYLGEPLLHTQKRGLHLLLDVGRRFCRLPRTSGWTRTLLGIVLHRCTLVRSVQARLTTYSSFGRRYLRRLELW